MTVSFSEFEIELFCQECDEDFLVTGKDLTQSPDVICPACGHINRVDVWGFHAQWARFRKLMGKL